MNSKKIKSMLLASAMVAGVCTGCMQVNYDNQFYADGTLDIGVEMLLYIDPEMASAMGGETGSSIFSSSDDSTVFSPEATPVTRTIDGKKYEGMSMKIRTSVDSIMATANTIGNNIEGFGGDMGMPTSVFMGTMNTYLENNKEIVEIKVDASDMFVVDSSGNVDVMSGAEFNATGSIDMMDLDMALNLSYKFPGNILSVQATDNSSNVTVDKTKNTVKLALKSTDAPAVYTIKAVLNDSVKYVKPDSKFVKQNTYKDNFKDVPKGAWYNSVVAKAYESGIVAGTSKNTFDPSGNLTVVQAIVMADRVHSTYAGNNEKFTRKNQSDNWYDPYIEYAVKHGIITEWAMDYSFDTRDLNRNITRYEMGIIFANSVPKYALEKINSNVKIPDLAVSEGHYKTILKLYEAGVITGSDAKGTFNPNNAITRAEAAAIISRIAYSAERISK